MQDVERDARRMEQSEDGVQQHTVCHRYIDDLPKASALAVHKSGQNAERTHESSSSKICYEVVGPRWHRICRTKGRKKA
jgi:hypothetical protein